MTRRLGYVAAALAIAAATYVIGDDAPLGTVTGGARLAMLRSAQVWRPTTVSAMDLREGPRGPGAFAPGESVSCQFIPATFDGSTPKFECAIEGGDLVKVKYGRDNGEVYAEVASSRLLWALGFGADRMYPVRVTCRGCPVDESGVSVRGGAIDFDPATIERKFGGDEIDAGGEEGWSWPELDVVDVHAGGAPLPHRDALKLVAALIQHTDSKREQQRLVCLSPMLSGSSGAACHDPFLLIQDLGKTFGRAVLLNRDADASVSFESWAATPVWRDPVKCVASLEPSATGTLANPRISEAGRAFLAGLLAQLSDAQLHDLFEVARFAERTGQGHRRASIDDWVNAFKDKRRQIESVACPS